jgi:hypothetical protein
LEKTSRKARNLLFIEISEARSLKNRLCTTSIREIVSLYRDFETANQLERLPIVIKDCLIS